MSSIAKNNLSREKIQQLLMAIGSEPMEDITQVEATEYDWHEPHYFNSKQLVKLSYFTEEVAIAIAQKLHKFCRSEFNVTVASTTQHYVHKFVGWLQDSGQMDYYLPFGDDQERMFGLIGIPEQSAFNWASQLLGESESERDSDRDLSQLEESLLLDMASVLVEAFSGPAESLDFHSAKKIVKGQWLLELGRTEELCKISFDIKKTDSEKSYEAYFLMLCSELMPVVGKTVRNSGEFSAEDISKLIVEHLREMPILITSQLASTMLSFEELMNLEENDIVLLDKTVDQPTELIVDGRTVYYGRPVKSSGKYAVTIEATAFEDTSEDINLGTGTK